MSDLRSALLPFHPQYARLILAGFKTIEVRKRALGWDRIYIYETGGDKLIVGRFDIDDVWPYQAGNDRIRASLTQDAEARYVGDREAFSHAVSNVVRFPKPVKWWKQAPQSVWSLSTDIVSRIEEAAFVVQASLLDLAAPVIPIGER